MDSHHAAGLRARLNNLFDTLVLAMAVAAPSGSSEVCDQAFVQLDDILDKPERLPALKSESQLRVAAAMLRNAGPGEISATTVVGVLGRDDLDVFIRLVAHIGDELDLDTRVRLHVGSFSVRFSRRECR